MHNMWYLSYKFFMKQYFIVRDIQAVKELVRQQFYLGYASICELSELK